MKLLPKLFIKNYNDLNDPKVRFAYGKMCGIVGIISNIFLCAFKIIVGLLSTSISIVADGINNLADAGSSIITLIGFKLASQPSDKDHPFGHQRYEYITGLIVSIIILFIGALLLKSSIESFFEEKELISTKMAIISSVVLALAILIKCLQCLFYRKYGKLINSQALIASSADSLNDCISTIAVMICTIICIFYPNGFLDGIFGIIVSIFILVSGIKLTKETISPLIGEAPTKEFTEKVISKILSYDNVLGVHDLVIHSYGEGKIFITCHVEVDAYESIMVTHDVIDNIEMDFRNDGLNLVIHMDPIDTKDEYTLKLKEETEKIIASIDDKIHFHDFRIVKGVTHTNVIFDIVVPNKYDLSNDDLYNLISCKLKEYDNKLNLVMTIDVSYI